MFTLTQIYNEKEQAKQGKIQTVQFKEKRGTRKWNGGAKVCALGNEKFKERPDSKWNKESGALRLRTANLATVERKQPKKFYGPKKQHKSKLKQI